MPLFCADQLTSDKAPCFPAVLGVDRYEPRQKKVQKLNYIMLVVWPRPAQKEET